MGRDRSGQRKGDLGRVPGGFVALPWSVLDSRAYAALGHKDRCLLIEIARQFVRDNNGRLLASRAYLKARGWSSADSIDKGIARLLEAGLIHQTVQGHRPNKASWFAVTWRLLDPHPGYDPGAAATFVRGSYLHATPEPAARRKAPRNGGKNARLSPMVGTGMPPIGPVSGQGPTLPGPMVGPIPAPPTAPPVPSTGHHLETPSAARRRMRAEPAEQEVTP